jgi:GT2 family glycosyltransferase
MASVFPHDLGLTPVSRWPTTLPDESVRAVIGTPVAQRVRRRAPARRPTASIVTVACDGLLFSRLCLESLLAVEHPIDLEVIVVDNASCDGTAPYLADLASRDRRLRVERMSSNAGFAAATNRGVALARGDILVFLNNDTIPVNSWVEGLVAHLCDKRIGLVGAVTNRAGNEAEITVPYRTYGELERFAGEHAEAHRGELFDIRTATMFCAALRRDVWETVGPLDERFGLGLFEDDDFSMRVRRAGFRVVCAEDVFVHHFGQASMGRLASTGEYGALFHANRQLWEAKWAMHWTPYAKRAKPDYQLLVERVRELVGTTAPPGSTVLVVTKGDEELLKFSGRRGWHFPQQDDGTYAGHHPPDSTACIAELERLRARGASFLVIPEPSRWWLTHYAQFADHLDRHYVSFDDQPGIIVALSARGGSDPADARGQ